MTEGRGSVVVVNGLNIVIEDFLTGTNWERGTSEKKCIVGLIKNFCIQFNVVNRHFECHRRLE